MVQNCKEDANFCNILVHSMLWGKVFEGWKNYKIFVFVWKGRIKYSCGIWDWVVFMEVRTPGAHFGGFKAYNLLNCRELHKYTGVRTSGAHPGGSQSLKGQF